MTYRVHGPNGNVHDFESAEEAVQWGRSLVYLSSVMARPTVDALESGHPASWSFDFQTVSIEQASQASDSPDAVGAMQMPDTHRDEPASLRTSLRTSLMAGDPDTQFRDHLEGLVIDAENVALAIGRLSHLTQDWEGDDLGHMLVLFQCASRSIGRSLEAARAQLAGSRFLPIPQFSDELDHARVGGGPTS